MNHKYPMGYPKIVMDIWVVARIYSVILDKDPNNFVIAAAKNLTKLRLQIDFSIVRTRYILSISITE